MQWSDFRLETFRKALHDGLAKDLKYVMFDSGPLYRVFREPVRIAEETVPVGYVYDTVLFREKIFDWVRKTR